MATAKKATKKTAAKKTASTSVAKKVAVKTPAPQPDVATTSTTKIAQPAKAVTSKKDARAAKTAAIASATETQKTINPKGSWPFPTGERP